MCKVVFPKHLVPEHKQVQLIINCLKYSKKNHLNFQQQE